MTMHFIVSCIFSYESVNWAIFCFSFFGVETEVDDPQVFVPPAYCEGVAFEEAPDDHSFFDLFHDWKKTWDDIQTAKDGYTQ